MAYSGEIPQGSRFPTTTPSNRHSPDTPPASPKSTPGLPLLTQHPSYFLIIPNFYKVLLTQAQFLYPVIYSRFHKLPKTPNDSSLLKKSTDKNCCPRSYWVEPRWTEQKIVSSVGIAPQPRGSSKSSDLETGPRECEKAGTVVIRGR